MALAKTQLFSMASSHIEQLGFGCVFGGTAAVVHQVDSREHIDMSHQRFNLMRAVCVVLARSWVLPHEIALPNTTE